MRLWSAITSVFAAIFARSQLMPDESEVFGTPLSKEADEFLASCNIGFNEKQEAFFERWIAGRDRYDVDFERGLLVLSNSDKVAVLCDIEIVGSYSQADESWEWAWNNPNATKSLVVPRDVLTAVGREYGLKYLLSGFVPVPNKKFPFYLSGIALKVRDALGVYEATHGDLSIFLLLKNPREADS